MRVKQTVSGVVTNKRTSKMSPGWAMYHHITIDSKEFIVSAKIYSKLSIGDYIKAHYKKGIVLDNDIIVKLL